MRDRLLHEVVCPSSIAPTDHVRNTELRIGINRHSSPHVASSIGLLLRRGILLLGSHKLPDFVALNPPSTKVSYVPIVVVSTNGSNLRNKLQNSVEGDATHAGSGPKRVALYQAGDEAGTLGRA
jgi:hypothetical protein